MSLKTLHRGVSVHSESLMIDDLSIKGCIGLYTDENPHMVSNYHIGESLVNDKWHSEVSNRWDTRCFMS